MVMVATDNKEYPFQNYEDKKHAHKHKLSSMKAHIANHITIIKTIHLIISSFCRPTSGSST